MATALPSPGSKPIIVVVTGAWHIPKHYSALASRLRALGHEVLIARLPSMNDACPPNAGLYTDTEHIRSYVENLTDAGHTVLVLMHSYGGMVVCNALVGLDTNTRKQAKLPSGVVRLIYMCAHIVKEGTSLYTIPPPALREQILHSLVIIKENGLAHCRRELVIGPGLQGPELDAYVADLVPWNAQAMYQITTAAAWRDIPVSYIMTMQDKMMSIDYQKKMVEGARAEGREVELFEVQSSRIPHAESTAEIVDIVHEIASREAE
ncbi:alpha/beta hydrolase [Aspergillus homomorphus CBS 101889]|uniref:Alpha/beta-hydrolase n=1 Tax=Aspergillus homomorphus (strain CBS 101889) TaxID=1450537 RepID=A0A395I775_ASPHC|nr:alpha/beta-hydrolase [Aspergillus homomorphus CBS 101889]RAL15143.1 alpha/beta-hydrolase [Aspergillus homomorphus CBS 101889]